MNIVLHPTYFPNISHFVAMSNASEITLETDDNYQKQTYRNRTYIYGANGLLQLSVPVIYSQNNRQKYRDIKIANTSNWQNLHWKSLLSAYSTSPFFEFYKDELHPLFEQKRDYLLDFNLECFQVICDCIQIDFQVHKNQTYKETFDNMLDYRHLVNARKERVFKFDNYTQVFNNKHGHISNLSILDLLFNEGTNTQSFLENQSL